MFSINTQIEKHVVAVTSLFFCMNSQLYLKFIVLVNPFVTSSVKTCLIEEQTVSSKISCIHAFVIVFMVNTVQGATKMLAVDFHERQIS